MNAQIVVDNLLEAGLREAHFDVRRIIRAGLFKAGWKQTVMDTMAEAGIPVERVVIGRLGEDDRGVDWAIAILGKVSRRTRKGSEERDKIEWPIYMAAHEAIARLTATSTASQFGRFSYYGSVMRWQTPQRWKFVGTIIERPRPATE